MLSVRLQINTHRWNPAFILLQQAIFSNSVITISLTKYVAFIKLLLFLNWRHVILIIPKTKWLDITGLDAILDQRLYSDGLLLS